MDNKIMTPLEYFEWKYPHPQGGFVIPSPEMVLEYAEYVAKEKAVAFFNWISKETYFSFIDVIWYDGVEEKTTAELYELFNNKTNDKK